MNVRYGGGRNGVVGGSRGAELIREGWKRDFPNARQPAEPNVIMRGEDFIMGRGNSLKLADTRLRKCYATTARSRES